MGRAISTGCVLALALALVVGASGTSQATGTLQLNSTFSAKWHRATCPAGVPSTLTCYPSEGQALVRGLGRVTATYMTTFDDGGTRCVRVLPDLLLTIAGKGSLTASMTGPACMAVPPSQSLFDAVITGGSGKYEGASGTIHIGSNSFERAPGEGVSTDAYTGMLNVSGLEFDLAAPVLSGAHSKTVRAPKGAKRVKVRYVVTAKDAVDGSVAAICKLRSGGFFKIGRTAVTCTAQDSSANTARARFTVTVKPSRR
jgi:HYR domain